MAEPFDISRLDRAWAEKKLRWEQQRLATLDQVLTWLETQGADYGIAQAYLFGSLIQPGRFSDRSDVDVAVESLALEHFFRAMGALSETVGRDVDLVELHKCPFAARICQGGLLWTKTSFLS